jgi:hypothetical protein
MKGFEHVNPIFKSFKVRSCESFDSEASKYMFKIRESFDSETSKYVYDTNRSSLDSYSNWFPII